MKKLYVGLFDVFFKHVDKRMDRGAKVQVDWREDYFMYQIIKDNTKIFNVDTSKIELDRAVELTINKLKTCL